MHRGNREQASCRWLICDFVLLHVYILTVRTGSVVIRIS
jgi:hypothetical protein